MHALLIIAALAINPPQDVAREGFDLLERNRFYDEQGRLVFEQILFYDWSPHADRFNVQAWRLVKTPNQIPERDHEAGDFVAVWQDGEILRAVRSEMYRESWTQYDPELVEREYLPKERRRDLLKLGKPKPEKQ